VKFEEIAFPRFNLCLGGYRMKAGRSACRTADKGDYILDNQNKNILLWSETRYQFMKRQSQADPNVWVSLSNQQPAIATATSR
jgi:hypothetical protein